MSDPVRPPKTWKRGLPRVALVVVMGMALFSIVQGLVQGDPRYGIHDFAGLLGALASVVAAMLLARFLTVGRRTAILFIGTPILAIALSPLALFLLVRPVTLDDVADSGGVGFAYGFMVATLLWALLEPEDRSRVLKANARLPGVVTVTVTKEGGLSLFPRVEEGDDVVHKMHTLAPGEAHLGVPFAEWERHAGSTVRVSEGRTLVPVTT